MTNFQSDIKRQVEQKIKEGRYPSTVYKFRCWDDEPNDHILRKRTIKLVSPSDLLADYPEARLPIDKTQLTEDNLMKYALHHAKKLYPNKHISYQQMQANRLRKKNEN